MPGCEISTAYSQKDIGNAQRHCLPSMMLRSLHNESVLFLAYGTEWATAFSKQKRQKEGNDNVVLGSLEGDKNLN